MRNSCKYLEIEFKLKMKSAKVFRDYLLSVSKKLLNIVKWIFFGVVAGVLVGAVSSLFAILIVKATGFRAEHPNILFALPLAGLFIIFMYHRTGVPQPKGTNLVLTAIHEGSRLPVVMAPLIFVSSVITHLFGGSAGREGAALQIGGSLGNTIGRILHFKGEDRRQVIMCGMSASFSALFGTPLAAAVLPMEISTVGILYYSALVPCAIASLTAHFVAKAMHVSEASTKITSVPGFTVRNAFITLGLSIAASMVSILFCVAMHKTKSLLGTYFKNAYLRIVVSGCLIILMTLLVGSQTYNGTGSQIIAACITDPKVSLPLFAFLLKILFTAVTLSGGYQGGEIVPSLFIGATFGVAFATITHVNMPLAAAIGMTCVFCGVTNCPLAALLISFEMFGFEAAPYFLMAVAITYTFSGNFGIYHTQKIYFSKYEPSIVDRYTH